MSLQEHNKSELEHIRKVEENEVWIAGVIFGKNPREHHEAMVYASIRIDEVVNSDEFQEWLLNLPTTKPIDNDKDAHSEHTTKG